MTTETTTTDVNELDRLREHNKQLLAELKAERGALKASQQALQAAQEAEGTWRSRWHENAVLAPLETELRGAAAGPWRYLRDTCMELGLLKMQPDEEGIERPVWLDEHGEPADLSKGVFSFLSDVYARTGGELGHCLRSAGTTGSGALQSPSRPYAPPPEPELDSTPVPKRPAFGLR
jgi:hypothetical protein